MGRLRLLKLVVQPTFVVDDGEHLVERLGQPFEVAEEDVPGFSEKWSSDFAGVAAKFEAGQRTD